jgi:hypothetical protein
MVGGVSPLFSLRFSGRKKESPEKLLWQDKHIAELCAVEDWNNLPYLVWQIRKAKHRERRATYASYDILP